MPTKRTRRGRRRREPVGQHAWAWLTDAPAPPDNGDDDAFEFKFLTGAEERRAMWEAHRDKILTAWVKDKPGTRPARWWEFDAPRSPVGTYPGCYYDGELPEPRRRIGGTGSPKYEFLAYAASFEFGLPTYWVDEWEVSYYNGRSKDIHGIPIGTEFSEGNFDGIAYDPDDPPIFESQAAYLERHGLLTPAEKGALTPEAFEPESVCFAA